MPYLYPPRRIRDPLLLEPIAVRLRVHYRRVHAPRHRRLLQEHRTDRLRPHIAARIAVERPTEAVRRQHAQPRKLHGGVRIQQQIRTAHNGRIALAAAHRTERRVQCVHRTAARGVQQKRRPLQTQRVADAIREHRPAAAGDAEAALRQAFVEPRFLRFGEAGANVDAGARAAQRLRIDTGIGDGLVGALEQQATLRVHDLRLLAVDAEELRIEAIDVVNVAGAPRYLGVVVRPAGAVLVDHVHLAKRKPSGHSY